MCILRMSITVQLKTRSRYLRLAADTKESKYDSLVPAVSECLLVKLFIDMLSIHINIFARWLAVVCVTCKHVVASFDFLITRAYTSISLRFISVWGVAPIEIQLICYLRASTS